MALFENIFGTRPAGRGEAPKEFKPAPFRKPGRLERNDPAAMRAYEEEKKAYEEDVQASIADTEKVLGKEWRKRAFERSRAEEPKRAQEALAERAAVNRNIRPADAELPPMPEEDVKGGEMVDLPGGGKASADTIRMLYKKKGERQAEKEAKETAFGRNIEARYAAAYEANRKRYEEELASRGFTPPKTREEESKFNAERMADFRREIKKREDSQKVGESFAREYRDLKRAANEARSSRKYKDAIALDKEAEALNEKYGQSLGNSTQRQRYFNQRATDEIRANREAATAARRKIRETQTGANEAATESDATTPQPTAQPPAAVPRPPTAPTDSGVPPEPTTSTTEGLGEIDQIIESFDEGTRNAFIRIRDFSDRTPRSVIEAEKNKLREKIKEIEGKIKIVRGPNAMSKDEKDSAEKQLSLLKSILN
jgi:hypothetical protein